MKKMMILWVAMSAFLCCTINLNAQEPEEQHPIDVQLDQCDQTSTYSIMECYRIATEAWDKELNKNYQALMKLLTKEEQAKLRASQRKWIEYRDLDLDFSGTMYYNMEGTMWRISAAVRRYEIVRTRALELKEYAYAKMPL